MPVPTGAPWTFDIQNMLDQSFGIVPTFPPASDMGCGGHRNTIAPTLNIVGDFFS